MNHTTALRSCGSYTALWRNGTVSECICLPNLMGSHDYVDLTIGSTCSDRTSLTIYRTLWYIVAVLNVLLLLMFPVKAVYSKYTKRNSSESTVQRVFKMTDGPKDQYTSLDNSLGPTKLPVISSKSNAASNNHLADGGSSSATMLPKVSTERSKKNAASGSIPPLNAHKATADICKSANIDVDSMVSKDPHHKDASMKGKGNPSRATEVPVTKPKRDRNFLLTTMLLITVVHGISGIVLASSKLAGLSNTVSDTVTAQQLEIDLREFVGATGICFNVLITTAYCLNGFTFMLYVGLYSYNILKGLVSSSLKSKSDKNKKALRRGRMFLAAGTLLEIAAWVPPLAGVAVAETDRHLRLSLFLVHYSLFVFLAFIVSVGIPRVLGLLVRRIKKNMDQNKSSNTSRSNVSTLRKFQVLIWLYRIGGSFLMLTMVFTMVSESQYIYLSTITPVYLAGFTFLLCFMNMLILTDHGSAVRSPASMCDERETRGEGEGEGKGDMVFNRFVRYKVMFASDTLVLLAISAIPMLLNPIRIRHQKAAHTKNFREREVGRDGDILC